MSELDNRANTHMNNCKHWFGSECSCNMSEASVELADLRARTTWQPIETAPKDGTEILVFNGTYKFLAEYKNNLWMSDRGKYLFPTHWMPLPEPPEEK